MKLLFQEVEVTKSLSSNFFKSTAVVQEREVRIINSNEIVAKKLENIAQYVKNDTEGEVENVL